MMIVAGSIALVEASVAEEAPEPIATMNQERLESLLRSIGSDTRGIPGMLEFTVSEVTLLCVSDPEHDRMRIIASIAPLSDLSAEQVGSILEVNFHTALDARYASSQGMLYSAFIHPLSPLTEAEIRSAVQQVSNLVRTFGNTYSSGALMYNAGEPL
jgi:hypothetical protein